MAKITPKELTTRLHKLWRSDFADDIREDVAVMMALISYHDYQLKEVVDPAYQYAVDAEHGDIEAAFAECINSKNCYDSYTAFAQVVEGFIEPIAIPALPDVSKAIRKAFMSGKSLINNKAA